MRNVEFKSWIWSVYFKCTYKVHGVPFGTFTQNSELEFETAISYCESRLVTWSKDVGVIHIISMNVFLERPANEPSVFDGILSTPRCIIRRQKLQKSLGIEQSCLNPNLTHIYFAKLWINRIRMNMRVLLAQYSLFFPPPIYGFGIFL